MNITSGKIITEGRLPFEINLSGKSRVYKQVDATDEEVMELIEKCKDDKNCVVLFKDDPRSVFGCIVELGESKTT